MLAKLFVFTGQKRVEGQSPGKLKDELVEANAPTFSKQQPDTVCEVLFLGIGNNHTSSVSTQTHALTLTLNPEP